MKPKTERHLNAHSKKRAFQRYGLNLNRFDLRELNKQIQESKGKFLTRQSHTRTIWLVNFKDKEIVCVYNKQLNRICTILTIEQYNARYGDV